MLQSGIIQRSTSPFALPVILVKKKGGTWHLCIDYHFLNKIMLKTPFLILVIEELKGVEIFSKLDLHSGYHQIRVFDQDVSKTTFSTHLGLYKFKVMPFRLTNTSVTFQPLMNKVYAEHIQKFILSSLAIFLFITLLLKSIFSILSRHLSCHVSINSSLNDLNVSFLGRSWIISAM